MRRVSAVGWGQASGIWTALAAMNIANGEQYRGIGALAGAIACAVCSWHCTRTEAHVVPALSRTLTRVK